MSYVNVDTICSYYEEDLEYCFKKHDVIFEGSRYQKTVHVGDRLKDAAFVDCFINPNGTQYYVGSCGHSHFAYDHCDGKSVSELENNDWLHFSKAYTDTIIVNEIVGVFTPTQAQVDTLFDILMDANKALVRYEAAGDGWNSNRTRLQIEVIDKFIKRNTK